MAEGIALNGDTRKVNTFKLLQTLQRHQPVCRTDLALLTGLSPTSVTRIVSNLIQARLVAENKLSPNCTGRSRRAINLRVRSEELRVAGFHIDPHRLYACVMDLDHTIAFDREIPITREERTPEAIANKVRAYLQSLPESHANIRALGFSVPGRVDADNAVVQNSIALRWENVALREALHKAINLPVYIENDVKSCLLAERILRNSDPEHDISYLYIGKFGVGFAHMIGNTLVRGRSNAAGEISELSIGSYGDIRKHLVMSEMLLSARQVCPELATFDEIITARQMRLPWACLIIDDFLFSLHTFLNEIEAFLDPHEVILGGEVIQALKDFPDLLPHAHDVIGAAFEPTCAMGAAYLSLRHSLDAIISTINE